MVAILVVYLRHRRTPEALLEPTVAGYLPEVWQRAFGYCWIILVPILWIALAVRTVSVYRREKQGGSPKEKSSSARTSIRTLFRRSETKADHPDNDKRSSVGVPSESPASSEQHRRITRIDRMLVVIGLSIALLFAYFAILGGAPKTRLLGIHPGHIVVGLFVLLAFANVANALIYGKVMGKHKVTYKADNPGEFRRDLAGAVLGCIIAIVAALIAFLFLE